MVTSQTDLNLIRCFISFALLFTCIPAMLSYPIARSIARMSFRIHSVPDFHFYAIADGASDILKRGRRWRAASTQHSCRPIFTYRKMKTSTSPFIYGGAVIFMPEKMGNLQSCFGERFFMKQKGAAERRPFCFAL